MRSTTGGRLGMLVAAIAMALFMRVALAGDPAVELKSTFIKGYIKAAVKRGVPVERAQRQADCVYNVVVSSMTVGQFIALAEEARHALPPTALLPVAPEIKALCLGGEGTGAMPARASPFADQRFPVDDADSSLVARELGRLRAEEEATLRTAQGHPVVLPTGRCAAIVTVGDDGEPEGRFPIDCSDGRMQDVMRQAVMAAAPLRAPPGSTVRLSVFAPRPEPGVAPIVMQAAGGPDSQDARLDIADSIAVTQRVASLRMQQTQGQILAGERPSRPIFAHCSATVRVNDAGAPADDFQVACDDPRIEDVMRQAVLAIGTPRAQPGSTVLLRVTAMFPAP